MVNMVGESVALCRSPLYGHTYWGSAYGHGVKEAEASYFDGETEHRGWEEPAAAPDRLGYDHYYEDDAAADLVPRIPSILEHPPRHAGRGAATWRWLPDLTLRRVVDGCLRPLSLPEETGKPDPADHRDPGRPIATASWRPQEHCELFPSIQGGGGGSADEPGEELSLCRHRITYPDGAVYEGECSHGAPHGHGVWTSPRGMRYVGGWAHGLQSGRGALTWPNGSKYEGEFVGGARHGRGVLSAPDGSMYAGHFRGDKMCGYGAYTWRDGSRYVGDFANDKPHSCLGRWYSAKRGAMYVGCVEGGTRTGLGTYWWTGGRRTAVRTSRSHRSCRARWEREGKSLARAMCRRLLASVGLAK